MKTDSVSEVPSVCDVILPPLPYFDPEYQRDPHGMNRRASVQSRLALGPLGPEALSYAAVEQVLRDRRFRMPGGLTIEAHGATSSPLCERTLSSLSSFDGEEHHRLRRLASRPFKPGCAAGLQTAMTAVISHLVDAVARTGWSEVVADIARPYAIAISGELLGAPAQYWRSFAERTDDGRDIRRAPKEFDDYIGEMVAGMRNPLSDGLFSNLIQAGEDGNSLTHDKLKMLVFAVLTGGTDTTCSQLASAVQVFCDHPAQWALLAEHPELAHQAADEVMRYAPVVLRTLRVAAEDVELAGVMIPAGTLVGANTAAANRDPSIFEEPDRFDILRESPAPALTFGGGIHFCLGAHLARAALAAALAVMARRMPHMDRTGPAPWKSVIGISGPIALPVAFEPGH